ncbi:MAG: glycosyltransferase family 1 protein [Clostridium sp.]
MCDKIRVLHVTEMLQAAGIESFIMNVYRNIDRERIQFDFFITRDEKEFYDDEISKLGGKKFVTNFNQNSNVFIRVLKESRALYKFLKKSDYQIIHVHSGTPLRIFYLLAAKCAGVKKRIYHSHSAEVKGPHSNLGIKKVIFKFLKVFFPLFGTDFFACSKAAGEWMYTKNMIRHDKVRVIYNGINSIEFQYDEEVRKVYRKELGLENKFVIGHVGRFNTQKNHTFLIDIFREIQTMDKQTVLLLLGEGELEGNIREKVSNLNLSETVKFLGVRHDVNKVMQAMDAFVLPSNYEGLPVVGVEAQAAGLPMFCSDNITNEVVITPNINLLSLNLSAKEWAKIIMQKGKKNHRKNMLDYIVKSGYDISKSVNDLQKFYEGR